MPDLERICFDASVLINILGSGVPKEILSAVGGQVVATSQVFQEVRRCPFESNQARGPLVPMLEGGYLEVLDLDEAAIEVFLSLVGAKWPNDLDDGEASTIAFGVTRETVVVIDEKKGRRICREQFPNLKALRSVDIFRLYSETCKDVGKFRSALSGAIERTKMHVPFSCRRWVEEILGYSLGSSEPARLRGAIREE